MPKNIIYIGDGTIDVTCMKLVKEQGEHSIAVYKFHTKEAKEKAMKLIKYERVNFVAPADYSKGKQIDTIVKDIVNLNNSRTMRCLIKNVLLERG